VTSAPCCHHAAAPVPATPPGGDFSLLDHRGHRVDAHAFGDRLLLVFFGFTHCRTVCPRELAKIGDALNLLGDGARQFQPLYISVDPERDTPAVLAAFLTRFHPGFVGLTGTPEEIEAVKRRFRVFARKAPDADDPQGYVVPHTAITYLAGPGGRYLAHFGDAIDAVEMARRLRSQWDRHQTASSGEIDHG